MRNISDKSNYYAIDYVIRYFIGQFCVLLCYKLCHILMRTLNYIKFVTKIIYGCRPGVWVTTPFSYLCVWKSPSIPSFFATQIVYIGYGQFKKKEPFSFYLSIAVLLVFLYLIAANKSVLVLYACAHKISLKYLFPENIAIEICCQNCQECNTFYVTTFFSIEFQGFVK